MKNYLTATISASAIRHNIAALRDRIDQLGPAGEKDVFGGERGAHPGKIAIERREVRHQDPVRGVEKAARDQLPEMVDIVRFAFFAGEFGLQPV